MLKNVEIQRVPVNQIKSVVGLSVWTLHPEAIGEAIELISVSHGNQWTTPKTGRLSYTTVDGRSHHSKTKSKKPYQKEGQ